QGQGSSRQWQGEAWRGGGSRAGRASTRRRWRWAWWTRAEGEGLSGEGWARDFWWARLRSAKAGFWRVARRSFESLGLGRSIDWEEVRGRGRKRRSREDSTNYHGANLGRHEEQRSCAMKRKRGRGS